MKGFNQHKCINGVFLQAGEQPGNAELPGQAQSCARQLLCIQMPTFGFQWSNQEEVFDAAQLWVSVCSKENLESSKLELHAVSNMYPTRFGGKVH